ncbi:hypothetical protein [Pararhodospirillum oryzae]|uniref:Uncharacterized protein n=1 Tax=Pararhodospirillum oryzae TaxID=478448 RepID=A0A512H717_9PROT|nr:hypothetical protein [Pararhodospirillum oryzae]GEO81265.1 hypothetical protein ROR02_13960 [Pararhodospirillum oryzae]
MWIFDLGTTASRFRDIKPLDRFAKSDGENGAVWIVDSVIKVRGMPPHARLVRQGDSGGGYRTISLSALADRTMYRRLSPLSAPPSTPSRRGGDGLSPEGFSL